MSAPYQGLGPTLAECLTAEKNALTAELAQVKAERDDWKIRAEERRIETDEAVEKGLDLAGSLYKEREDARAERDTAISHLEAVLDWSNTERFAGRTRHENDAPFAARAFLLSMREKADE